jgi:hypothetical protein
MESALANKIMDGFKDLLKKRFGELVGFQIRYERPSASAAGWKLCSLVCYTMDSDPLDDSLREYKYHRGTNIAMFSIAEDEAVIFTDWDGRQRSCSIGDPTLFNRMVGDIARCYVQYTHWYKQVNCENTSD